MTLGEQIRQERKRYGMSQAELARRVHVSKQAMNDLEQGKTSEPRFSLICAIAQVLGISLDSLKSVSQETLAV
jgi:transcriptional regulator with XRE-family HTH domain